MSSPEQIPSKIQFVRRDEKEIETIREKMISEAKDPTQAVIYGTVTGFLAFIILAIFPTKYSPDPMGISFETLGWASLAGFIATLILYGIKLKNKRDPMNDGTFGICSGCSRIDHAGKKKCECGGVIEPHEFYRKK